MRLALSKAAVKPVLFSSLFLLLSCGRPENLNAEKLNLHENYNKYWNSGKAELNRYSLKQARYGSVHEGHLVLVFVTEPFLKDKQVKPDRASDGDYTVLKMNRMRKFTTGVYDYSMMTSIFTSPYKKTHPRTVKLTMSGQDWCGMVFTQYNLRDQKYRVRSFSYFEDEGDQNFQVKAAMPEDEIFNLIRLDYRALPQGKIKIIPSEAILRLKHEPTRSVTARAELKEEGKQFIYSVTYSEKHRLVIRFEKEFPHRITSFNRSFKSGWGENARMLNTEAVLEKTIRSPYWQKHQPEDKKLREELGLQGF